MNIMNVFKILVIGIIVAGLGCDKIKNVSRGHSTYHDCVVSELQKFSYEPTSIDRSTVELLCESKYPHEKEIYNVEISWTGRTVEVVQSSKFYKVTKVKILSGKGECNSNTVMDRWFDYHIINGKFGISKNWDEAYKCFNPKKSRFFGVMIPEEYNKLR